MSPRTSGIVAFIAEQRGCSRRTVERLFASGKVPGAYKTRGGHWRLRKLPPNDVETVIRLQAETLLRELKALLFPQIDDVMEMTLAAAGVTNDDIVGVTHPDSVVRKRNRKALKARDRRKWELLCHRVDWPNFKAECDKLKKPRARLGVKGLVLKLHGHEVTFQALADILSISVPTLYARFGRETVQPVCRDLNMPLYPAAPFESRFDLREQVNE